MVNEANGLVPKFKPLLGIGWNRALPAPFYFGNGITPDGANDLLEVKTLIGTAMPTLISFDCWIKTGASFGTNRVCELISNYIASVSGLIVGFWITNAGSFQIQVYDQALGQFNSVGIALNLSAKNHCAFALDLVNKTYSLWVNSIKTTGTMTYTYSAGGAVDWSGLFRKRIGVHNIWNFGIDEARLYNRLIGDEEILANYNSGIGNSPAKTEGLIWWFNFETAEADTALWPGGNPSGWTSGAWGVRDQTNNNNHAQQINFASNNATLGGAIATF